MSTRKENLESLMQSMYVIRRKALRSGLAKTSFAYSENCSITPSQWAVLGIIIEKKEVNLKDIAADLKITSSAATQLVDGLVEKDFLVRERSSNDRRSILLRLSDKSHEHLASLKKDAAKRITTMFEPLTDDEVEQYALLNQKIANNLLKKEL